MRWGLVSVGLLTLAGAALATVVPAHADGPVGPANGDFEGALGWAPANGGTLTIDASQPVHGGGAAGHVQSSAAAPATIRTQYWLTPAAPGNDYTLTLALRIPAATMTAVTARLDLVTLGGAVLASNQVVRAGPTAGYVMISTTPVTAPPGTEHALVVITGNPTVGGARFSVDDVVVNEVIPPPPPAALPEPVLPDPDPGPAPAVATPIRSAERSVPVRLPTATPAPAPRPSTLVNGTFDTGLGGWSVVQGRAWTDTWIPGEGHSLVLHTDGASTVWAEQSVNGVQPGAWYHASALLSTHGEVERGWLRISWHDEPDGRGRTLGNDDSAAVGISEGRELAAAPRYQVVGTRAVQAPLQARSATVRFMLRSGATASLIVDNVTFGATAGFADATAPAEARPPIAPVAPVAPLPAAGATEAPSAVLRGAFPTPRPAATRTRAPAAPSSAVPSSAAAPTGARANTTPLATPAGTGLRAEDVVAPGIADAQRAFRMTQVLPDPPHPGRDHEYEWVEITNLGAVPASVEGMTLHDNSGSVVLPALVIPAGGSLVISARLAEVSGGTAFRLPQGIGNGLGNTGDRLLLTGADGRRVDAFSYGEDVTFLAGPRIPAPGTGRAILRQFGADGVFRAATVLDQPAPGLGGAVATPPPPAASPAGEGATVVGAAGAAGTWVVLIALGAGLLGGAAAQRLSSIRRGRA